MKDYKTLLTEYENYKSNDNHNVINELIDVPMYVRIARIVFNKDNVFKMLFVSNYPKGDQKTIKALRKAGFTDDIIAEIRKLYRGSFKAVARKMGLPLTTDNNFFSNLKIDGDFDKKEFYNDLELEFKNALKYARDLG